MTTDAQMTLPDPVPRLPGWIALAEGQGLEDLGFLSGATLAHLHLVGGLEGFPHGLWRERLALAAAEACAGFAGRRERAAELRDAVHLTRPGDHPGPGGEIFGQWLGAVARPVAVDALARALPGIAADRIAACLAPQRGNPVDRAAGVLEAVLTDAPRAQVAALILADAALARALGWGYLLPVLALGLRPRDLRKEGEALRLACHRAVVVAGGNLVATASELVRRGGRLAQVVPQLRAKGAERAVALFLARDALAASALTQFMSDRAARRLCDRLVELGALRELTGRDTFRLYGV